MDTILALAEAGEGSARVWVLTEHEQAVFRAMRAASQAKTLTSTRADNNLVPPSNMLTLSPEPELRDIDSMFGDEISTVSAA